MKIKKLITVCLTVVMVCTMMCIPAFASYSVESGTPCIVNSDYADGAEVFIRLQLNADGTVRYYDIPVSVKYPKSDDSFLSSGIVSGYYGFEDRSFNLGHFEIPSDASIDVRASIHVKLPAGTYQLSTHIPTITYSLSINDVSYSGNWHYHNVSLEGSYLTWFGYNSTDNRNSKVIDVFMDCDTEISLWQAGGIDFSSSKIKGQSGDLIFSVSPLYMYIGEPLDDGLIFPDPSDLEIFMDNASTIFHSVINWVALTAETIVSNPLILIFSIVPYIGLGVSIYARIKRSKK